jgi:hypothetical protein
VEAGETAGQRKRRGRRRSKVVEEPRWAAEVQGRLTPTGQRQKVEDGGMPGGVGRWEFRKWRVEDERRKKEKDTS